MGQSAPLGICSVQISPLDCDGNPDTTTADLVSCNVTQIEVEPILRDAIELDDPSGIPGKNCVEIRIDETVNYYDVIVTTCSVFDSELHALLGLSETVLNATGDVVGTKALQKQDQYCICECGTTSCKQRVAMTTWSMNMCPGEHAQTLQFAPDGQYWVNMFPMLQFRPNTETITLNNELNGHVLTARAYENANFGAGPGSILPANEAPYDRCRYELATDVCPPTDACNCLACNVTRPAPLVLA